MVWNNEMEKLFLFLFRGWVCVVVICGGFERFGEGELATHLVEEPTTKYNLE